jgi:hypothetical protein
LSIPDPLSKEKISEMLVRAIVHEAGYSVKMRDSEDDFGIDALLSSVEYREGRYRPTGIYVDLQLKSTMTAIKVNRKNGTIPYRLRGKNYDDMCVRNLDNQLPLLLIIAFLPKEDKISSLIRFNKRKTLVVLRGRVFWYRLPREICQTNNGRSKTIHIPISNVFDHQAVCDVMQKAKRRAL